MEITTTCPICLNKICPILVEKWNEYEILNCPCCSVSFSNPMRAGSREWYEGSFNEITVNTSNFNDRWEFMQALKDRPAPYGELLEIGCGEGLFLEGAKKGGYKVVGIDFNKLIIEVLKKRGIEAYSLELEDFINQFPERKFDVIVAHHVLEHLEKPQIFMKNIGQILRHDGYLIFSVPNSERIRVLFGREDWDYPPHHLLRWTKGSMKKFITLNGLKIVRMADEPLSVMQVVPHFMEKTSLGINRKISNSYTKTSDSSKKFVLKKLFKLGGRVKRYAVFTILIFWLPFLKKYRHRTGHSLYVLAKKGTSQK